MISLNFADLKHDIRPRISRHAALRIEPVFYIVPRTSTQTRRRKEIPFKRASDEASRIPARKSDCDELGCWKHSFYRDSEVQILRTRRDWGVESGSKAQSRSASMHIWNTEKLPRLRHEFGRATAHAARDICCSKLDTDVASCVRRISARESKKARVDSAPWFRLTRSICKPSLQPPL